MIETRIPAGSIAFVVKELHTRRGDGVSVDVRAARAEGDLSVVRLDWFPDCPHYHYNAGTERNREIPLDSALIGDCMEWFLDRIPERLETMVDAAGHPGIAKAINRGALVRAMPEVKRTAKAFVESMAKASAQT